MDSNIRLRRNRHLVFVPICNEIANDKAEVSDKASSLILGMDSSQKDFADIDIKNCH